MNQQQMDAVIREYNTTILDLQGRLANAASRNALLAQELAGAKKALEDLKKDVAVSEAKP